METILQANHDWMTENCQLACGTCRAPPATPGTFLIARANPIAKSNFTLSLAS